MKKRILAAVLSATMIFTQAPCIYADEVSAGNESAVSEESNLSEAVEDNVSEAADSSTSENIENAADQTENTAADVTTPESDEADVAEDEKTDTAANEEVIEDTEETSAETEAVSEEETEAASLEDFSFTCAGESYSNPTGADNDELFAEYVDSVFSGEQSDSVQVNSVKSGQENLSTYAAKIYDIMKEKVTAIANGTADSGILSFDLDEIYGSDKPTAAGYTLAELGIEELTQDAVQTAMKKLYNEIFWTPFNEAYNALMVDCPYEFYWHNKKGGIISPGYTVQGNYVDNVLYLKFGESAQDVTFCVSVDYTDGTSFEYNDQTLYSGLNTTKTAATTTSCENAKAIVRKYADASDYNKLLGYKDEICGLVTYNDAAADEDNNVPYGDPWQMIYVFDNDPNTNVVCEGYSKAFQYLCDNTAFDNAQIKAITVYGNIRKKSGNEGGHMWNIVCMGSKENYLVDVTWCDTDDENVSENDEFMIGTTEHEGNSYYFPDSAGQTYIYDDEMPNIYDAASLLIFTQNYNAACTHESTVIKNEAEATCTEDGYTGDTCCAECGIFLKSGKKISKTGHSFTDYVSDNNATYVKDGTKTAKCENCSVTKTITDAGTKKEKTDLSDCTVTLSYTSAAYTGSELKPTVVVKDGTETVPSSYYTVDYTDNKYPGTATVEVEAKGGNYPYSGTVNKTFTIRISISSLSNVSTGITVTWPKTTDASGYYLYRGSTKIDVGSKLSYTDTKATANGTKYSYKVVAYKTSGTEKVTLSTSAVKYIYRLSSPTIKTLTNSASKTMKVTLSAKNTAASGFQIQSSLSKSFTSPKTTTVSNSTLSKTIGSLTKGKTYYVRVRAYKKVGTAYYYSAWSATKYIKITK